MEGIALLRAFAGAYDREFTLARFREIRELLESQDALGAGTEAQPGSTRDGYDSWAPSYDEQLNQPLEIEEPIVREILDGLPVGVALDAACGTPVLHDGPDGELRYMPAYAPLASDSLAAALPLGFRVLRCDEPRVPSAVLDDEGRTIHDGERLPPQDPDDPPYIWALHAEAIDAMNAAWRGRPSSIIWHFRLEPPE